MKIIREPSLRQAITEAYFAWFDAYTRRQWNKMLPHIAGKVALFGQEFGEMSSDSEKAKSYLRNDFFRLPGTVSYRVKESQVYEVTKDVALLMVALNMTTRINDSTVKLPVNRISAVMVKENGAWKLGHVHFSRYGDRFDSGEGIPGQSPGTGRKKTGAKATVHAQSIEAQKGALERLNIAKDRVLSVIAHDLKNPFHNIMGYSELLRDNLDQYDKKYIQSVLQSIHMQARETYDLLENLLFWSQARTGGLAFRPSHFLLFPVVEKEVAYHAAAAGEKGVSFSYELHEKLEVCADKQMLRIVLRNLIHNAVRFNHKNGNVRIAASSDQFFVHIIVSDTGIGMSREIQDNLWKRLNNQSLSDTFTERSFGLGLVICKECIARHNGHLWFESEPDGGSFFTFTLPVIVPGSANELFHNAE